MQRCHSFEFHQLCAAYQIKEHSCVREDPKTCGKNVLLLGQSSTKRYLTSSKNLRSVRFGRDTHGGLVVEKTKYMSQSIVYIKQFSMFCVASLSCAFPRFFKSAKQLLSYEQWDPGHVLDLVSTPSSSRIYHSAFARQFIYL